MTAKGVVSRVVLVMMVLLLLFRSISVTVAWWEGEMQAMGWTDWLWVAMLPGSLWLWFRYLSVFGCREGQCLLPGEKERR
jgi:hypothetical protein